ncbi:uncharacterized protein KZ484_017915 [Pholidichthys leucotaenia]
MSSNNQHLSQQLLEILLFPLSCLSLPPDFPQDDCKEEDVQADQQLWNQERNSFVKQEEPEPPEIKEEWEELESRHIKEEKEEFYFSQQGELLVVKVEDNTFMVPPVYEENSHSEVKPNSEQLLYHNSTVTEVKDEERSWHADSKSTKEEEEPKPNKRCLTIRSHRNSDDEFVIQWENETDFPQGDCKEEHVQGDQQLWNQERNSFVKQEEPEPPEIKEEWEEREPRHIKEEEEEFYFNQQGELLVVKVEDDTFMVPPVYEENSHSEVKPNSEQLLYHNSTVTEVKDEERSWHADSKSTKEEEPKPKKRCLTIRSHSNSDDEFVIQWENETDDQQLHNFKEEEVLNIQKLYNKERDFSLVQKEQDATQATEVALGNIPVEDDHELKQETDSFMDTPACEENDHSDTSTDSDYLPSHNLVSSPKHPLSDS